jgi:hypothetical protein
MTRGLGLETWSDGVEMRGDVGVVRKRCSEWLIREQILRRWLDKRNLKILVDRPIKLG